MRDTSYPGANPHLPGPHNLGYQRTATGVVDVTDWHVSAGCAAGDVISTAADLERLTVALFSGRVVPKAQFRHMLETPGGVTMYDSTDPDSTEPASYTMGLTLVFVVNSTDAKSPSGNPRKLPIVLAALQDSQRASGLVMLDPFGATTMASRAATTQTALSAIHTTSYAPNTSRAVAPRKAEALAPS
jgi:D-alanyl-D-alanine carboxypeptidase